MSNFNPLALVFWAFCAGIGFLVGEDPVNGTVGGLVVGLGITLFVSALPN